jgi:hypothetical protein
VATDAALVRAPTPWEPWNQWTVTELPRINRAVLPHSVSPDFLTSEFRTSVLAALPAPEALAPATTRRLLVLPGLAGSSIARHFQEADLAREARPQEAFDQLRVGTDGTPLLDDPGRAPVVRFVAPGR